MNTEEMNFIFNAKTMVQENPVLFGHLITACTEGIEEKVRIERERAADFETIAAAYMAIAKDGRKTPTTMSWADGLIKSKMLKWEGKTCCNFDDEIAELKQN